jgi:hypothetical protein
LVQTAVSDLKATEACHMQQELLQWQLLLQALSF